MSNGGWSVYYFASSFAGNSVWFAYDYQNLLIFGKSATDALTEASILRPEEAWNIDKKIDDGKPGTGKVIAKYWNTCTDAASNGSSTTSDRTDSSYLLTDTSIRCPLTFPQAF